MWDQVGLFAHEVVGDEALDEFSAPNRVADDYRRGHAAACRTVIASGVSHVACCTLHVVHRLLDVASRSQRIEWPTTVAGKRETTDETGLLVGGGRVGLEAGRKGCQALVLAVGWCALLCFALHVIARRVCVLRTPPCGLGDGVSDVGRL